MTVHVDDMSRLLRAIRRRFPGASDIPLAYVSLRVDDTPDPEAWRPFRAVRLLRGRSWTISFVRIDDIRTRAVVRS